MKGAVVDYMYLWASIGLNVSTLGVLVTFSMHVLELLKHFTTYMMYKTVTWKRWWIFKQ